MNNITLKTNFLTYKISPLGENIFFGFNNSDENYVKKSPAAYITNNDRQIVNCINAGFNNNILTFTFQDDTVAEIEISEKENHLTFTLKEVSREDFLSITYLNIILDDCKDNCACLLAMTLATHMKEHPGYNTILRASAYPHIGLFKTSKSNLPSKAAVIGCRKEMLPEIQKEVLATVPKGELPFSNMGGPYAENALPDSADAYSIFFETVTDKNVDDVIDSLKKFSINQIILHHYGHYTQGDFNFDKNVYPEGMTDFKKIINKFHSEGIKVGLQTYSFFLVPKSSYVTPVPHKDLDIIKEFTLSGDISGICSELNVCECTDDVTAEEGFIYVNSPYLWIDDELLKFSKAENGKFEILERGALGTKPAIHKSGARVKQLKEYFLIPLAKAGSDLFYEIAKNTAEFYNECGADFFYLDALDGAFVLDGEDYVWYHAADFIREMFKYINRDIIFDCCYNPEYTGSWYVRSRYGAIDVSLIAHRRFFDSHINYNKKTAHKMGVTPEMGWIDLYPDYSETDELWQSEIFTKDDLEYVCAKSYATNASMAFLELFHKLKNTKRSEEYCEILKKYADYRKKVKPTENTKEYLAISENGATLIDDKLIKTKYESGLLRYNGDTVLVNNVFEKQEPEILFEPLLTCGDFDSDNYVTLLKFDENEYVKPFEYRFEKPVDFKGNRGIGVWCYGDNSGAIVCIALRGFALSGQRNGEHFIKIDFSGWKYFTFCENENETLPTSHWERRELEYTTYYNLQKFYHHFRPNINYSAIDGIDIKIKGNCNIRLKDIKLLPYNESVWTNPEIFSDDFNVKIFDSIKYGELLYFDGEKFVIKDKISNILRVPKFDGKVILSKGEGVIKVKSDGENNLIRAKITFNIKGDILQ